MSNEDLSRSVRRAIETLPVGAGARERGDINIAGQLLTVAISLSRPFAGRTRALESATPKAAAAELLALARALRQLDKALSKLSREAHGAADASRKKLTGSQIPSTALIALFFRENYPRLAEAAELAAEDLKRDSLGRDQHRGRRCDERARGLAREAALAYCRVTGRRSTRRTDVADGRDYSPFFDFLRKIFRLAGVKANISSSARFAIGDLNETYQPVDEIASG